jgi:outer membrane protein assembly factor BamB
LAGYHKRWFRKSIALLMAAAASAANAQWQPQWSTAWQHPETFHSATPLRVCVGADGATFAAVNVVHHSLNHVALVRFNADGSFAWTQEHVATSLAGIAFVGKGQVAIAGDGGTANSPVYVRLYDAATGDLVWSREAGGGRTRVDDRFETPQLVVDAFGNLMVLASDHGDYVVIRFDADGNALPTWRRTIDLDSDVLATAIVPLPDGGAVISGRGRVLGGGNVTVRLDAQGNEIFTDIEIVGPFPYGPAYLGVDSGGNAYVAAAQETPNGVPRAQVWKLSPNGARLWTTIVPNPGGPTSNMSIGGFAMATNGDALIEADAGAGSLFRLVRLDGATGSVVSDFKAPIGGTPSTLALATNGRVLVGGDGPVGGGHVLGAIAEFDAGGEPCRVATDINLASSVNAVAGSSGWSVIGVTTFVPGVGNDALAIHFDSDGACTLTDRVFSDGFEPEVP